MNRGKTSALSVVDLLSAAASGVLIGYFRQRLADSGQLKFDKLSMSMLLGSTSFVLAFCLVKRLQSYRRIVWPWAFVAVAGSVICSFTLHVVYYSIHNLKYKYSRSYVEYIAWTLPDMALSFVFAIFLYSALAICIMGALRILVSHQEGQHHDDPAR